MRSFYSLKNIRLNKLLFTCLLAVLCLPAGVFAGELVNDRNITIQTEADVLAKRQLLIDHIWGKSGFPHGVMPELPVIRDDISPVKGLPNLERVDTMVFQLDHGYVTYAHHFIPSFKVNRLVILHHGHATTFDDSAEQTDETYGLRRTLEGLLSEGYSVLAMYMPRYAVFQTTITVDHPGLGLPHAEFYELNPPLTGSPLKYFMDPVAAALNYIEARSEKDEFPQYTDISMVGFSGGGWTMTLYTAIDPRIKLGISVAGSIPLYMRSGDSIGDNEQTDPALYSLAGYLDLYIMGAHGPGRRQIHVLNRNDDCCYGVAQHDPLLVRGYGFVDAVRQYEYEVRLALISLGNTDIFRVDIDESALGHMVSWDNIYDTILIELADSRRMIGTTPEGQFVANTRAGLPGFWISGRRMPNRLRRIMGAPAILQNAANINDVFYRTAANNLVHVPRPTFAWGRERILKEGIISDPAAVSLGPERFSVVALGKDYRLYHFTETSPPDFSGEIVSEEIKALGSPAMLVTAPNRLDLFFRGWERQVFHAYKTGNDPWQTVSLAGFAADTPTAAVSDNGVLFVFIRNREGALLTRTRSPGPAGQWSPWGSVSAQLGAPPIYGKPSAHFSGKTMRVYARSESGSILRFSFSGEWTLTDLGGNITGSMAAMDGGFLARSVNGNLLTFTGGEWTDLGVPID